MAEGPHSRATRSFAHAHRAEFPWVASTMRLQQNVMVCRDMIGATDADLDRLWVGYKSILQLDTKKARKLIPKRISDMRFTECVYGLEFPRDPPGNGGGGDAGGEGGDGGGPPGGFNAGEGDGEEDDGGNDSEEDDGGNDGDGGGPPDGGGDGQLSLHHKADQAKLLAQWFQATLQVHDYISLPVQAEEGPSMPMFCQVLDKQPKLLLVSTWETRTKPDELYTIVVQCFERWAPLTHELEDLRETEEVYVYAEPCSIDLLAVCGVQTNVRDHIYTWTPVASDVAGCISLTGPQVMKCQVQLSSPKVPVLCLLDALNGLGYVSVNQKMEHTKRAPLQYDGRKPLSKRFYFQCVLALEDCG